MTTPVGPLRGYQNMNEAMRRAGGKSDLIGTGEVKLEVSASPVDVDVTPTLMVCQVCDVQLNRFDLIDGTTSYIHSRSWREYDHDPIPVEVPRSDPRAKQWTCDFCGSDDDVNWEYHGPHISLKTGNTDMDYGSIWAGCELCDPYVKAGDIVGLRERIIRRSLAFKGIKGQHLEEMRKYQDDWLGQYVPHIHLRKRIRPFEAGPLHIRNMPKMRDRLVTTWRDDGVVTALRKVIDSRHLPGFTTGDDEAVLVKFPDGALLPLPVIGRMIDHIVTALEVASLYWISNDFTNLALHAAHDLPNLSITREEMPAKSGFLVWEQPIGEIERPGGMADVRAVSWTLVPGGVWVNFYMQPEDKSIDLTPEECRERFGWLIPPGLGGFLPFDVEIPEQGPSSVFLMTRALLSTWFLMQQPGVGTETSAPVDKRLAKSYQRAKKTLPDVRVVDLRRHAAPREEPTEPTDGRKVTVRFMVRGHWKRQAYGTGRSLRKTIYVAPFMKGPDGAPLKVDIPTVRRLR